MKLLKLPLWLAAGILVQTLSAATSALWGTNGELWSASGRLPDFSYAGYHSGEAAIPELPRGRSVKEFGARGDGFTDDTAAFLRAISEAKGVIEIPPGRYLITNILEIKRSGVVLRGSGANQTVLFFLNPLEKIHPRATTNADGLPTTAWSWSGGLVTFQGTFGGKTLADISVSAARGDAVLDVTDVKKLQVGQRVEVVQHDNPDNSLAAELYSGDPGKTDNLNGNTIARQVVCVVRIDGNHVHIDRALRFAVNPRWHPKIVSFQPTVSECGIENLRIEFPRTAYGGHFKEAGFNAVAFNGVADCWARNLVISNADSGIFIGANFCSLDDIVITSSRPMDGQQCTGHHGVSFYGCDNQFVRFDYRTRFIHDISVEDSASGNVFAGGRGVDLCFDHHERTPFANLFTDIDVGAGTRLWRCGGRPALGKHSGARETFWNIRSRKSLQTPPENFGPASMNFIALTTDLPSTLQANGKWFESIPPEEIFPLDLHAAQLARRLGAK
jgi:hypothetical protein